jgi:hypothetical protein
VSEAFVFERNNKVYLNAQARIISDPEELPRELAFALKGQRLNPQFVWVSGRFVQGEQMNSNGQFWTTDDLKSGEYSIQYTPLNVLHEWQYPIGTIVETKLVHREAAAEGELLPEIQALSLIWAANFPQVAEAAREAHGKGKLWYSMECTGAAKQCLTCNNTYEWAAARFCAHLEESKTAPRRFIDPIFHGGALIFPPVEPGWVDADIEEVAKAAREYADRKPVSYASPLPEGIDDGERAALEHLYLLRSTQL